MSGFGICPFWARPRPPELNALARLKPSTKTIVNKQETYLLNFQVDAHYDKVVGGFFTDKMRIIWQIFLTVVPAAKHTWTQAIELTVTQEFKKDSLLQPNFTHFQLAEGVAYRNVWSPSRISLRRFYASVLFPLPFPLCLLASRWRHSVDEHNHWIL